MICETSLHTDKQKSSNDSPAHIPLENSSPETEFPVSRSGMRRLSIRPDRPIKSARERNRA